VSSTTHLDLTMGKRPGADRFEAALILLLVVLTVHVAGRVSLRPDSGPLPEQDTTFVQVAGAVRNPGVYAFPRSPYLKELARRAGFSCRISDGADFDHVRFVSGSRALVTDRDNHVRVETDQMPAFYKMTLGIPISLSIESPEGLTALPGIGPGLADAIVAERKARSGFRAVKDLLAVPGISLNLCRKIQPYVKP
jgi:hypothetical protein